MYICTTNKYNRTGAPSEDSDQPAHSRSLIRIVTGRFLDSQECKVLHADNEDWLDCPDAQADLSLRLAHRPEGTFSAFTAVLLMAYTDVTGLVLMTRLV